MQISMVFEILKITNKVLRFKITNEVKVVSKSEPLELKDFENE